MQTQNANSKIGCYVLTQEIPQDSIADSMLVGYHQSTGLKVNLRMISKQILETDNNLQKKIDCEVVIMDILRHHHLLPLLDVLDTEQFV